MLTRKTPVPMGGVLLQGDRPPIVTGEASELCSREVESVMKEQRLCLGLDDRDQDLQLGKRQRPGLEGGLEFGEGPELGGNFEEPGGLRGGLSKLPGEVPGRGADSSVIAPVLMLEVFGDQANQSGLAGVDRRLGLGNLVLQGEAGVLT